MNPVTRCRWCCAALLGLTAVVVLSYAAVLAVIWGVLAVLTILGVVLPAWSNARAALAPRGWDPTTWAEWRAELGKVAGHG